MDTNQVVIKAREKDIGGLIVRRILPYEHCMVGPFIFFDHMGPAEFSKGMGIDVRPHPHINLATVTYLFEGKILHRDSLGSCQLIEPGEINWMVAGHGIVHSERTPADLRETGSRLNGIQCWLALPEEKEEMPASFTHYAAGSLPEFEINKVKLKLLLGNAFDLQSPVAVQSTLFYLEAKFPKGSKLVFPAEAREVGVYIVSGQVNINNTRVNHCSMAITHENMTIEAIEDAHLMFLGGTSLGQRYIYWNYVSSSKEKLDVAIAQWANGPGEVGTRFEKIPGDDFEYIPLPSEKIIENPKGTIM